LHQSRRKGLVGCHDNQVAAIEQYPAGARNDARQRAQKCRLASAVAPDQWNDLTRLYVERPVAKRRHSGVAGAHFFQRQQRATFADTLALHSRLLPRGLYDALIRQDRIRLVVGDLLAMMEHNKPIGQTLDRLDHVLDDQRADAPLAPPADHLDHLVDLHQIEPGHHLVAQQHLRIHSERLGQFETLDEGAVRQVHDAEHAPDQRKSERHDGVKAAERDAVQKDLRQQVHCDDFIRLGSASLSSSAGRLPRIPGRHRAFGLLTLNDRLWQANLPVFGERDRTVQALEIQLRQGIPHLLRVSRSRVLDRLSKRLDVSCSRCGMVVRLIGVFRLVGFRELNGIAKPFVFQRGARQPCRHAEGEVRILPKRSPKVCDRHTHGERIHFRRRGKAQGLPDQIEDFGLMPGHEHHVDVRASDPRQQN
jgi:hypothetical protein